MALRDQPYIPLYIQDFLTDEKLIECSAQATGVYVRLMCILHKSDEYGKILLKQKDKQTDKQHSDFALKLAKQMPYSVDVILSSLVELISEGVIFIDGDYLCQKRMIKDNELSLTRAKAGKKGGNFAQAKIKANYIANTENENEIENEDESKNELEDSRPLKIQIQEAIFSDEIFMDQLKMTHKGKDLKEAWEECWTHHSAGPSPPRESWEWRQKLNTWLSIKKTNNGITGTFTKKTTAGTRLEPSGNYTGDNAKL